MNKIILATVLTSLLTTGYISESWAEDCPAGKVRGVSSGNCIDATGNCGENCTYTINSNGLMTISGSGEMTDYDLIWDDDYVPSYKDSQGNLAPGYKYERDLKEVVFAPGSNITTIGQGFLDSSYITGITIPDSVTSIGVNGLYTNSLESLVIPATVEYIGDDAIYGKNNMNIIMTDATDITDFSFSFGYSHNLTITCIGSQEGCDELVNKSGGLIESYTLGNANQCNASSKHYFTGESCEQIPTDGSHVVCSNGYLGKGDSCIPASQGCGENYRLSDGICYRVRYTPAEAAEVAGDSNTIFLYYK